MLDIRFVRENPDVVKQNIKNKFQDEKLPLVDKVIELDASARKAQQEADNLRASRKKISKEIGALMAQGKTSPQISKIYSIVFLDTNSISYKPLVISRYYSLNNLIRGVFNNIRSQLTWGFALL